MISIIQVGPDVRHIGEHAIRSYFVFYKDLIYPLGNCFNGIQDFFVNCLRVEVIANDELAEDALVLRQLAMQAAVRSILTASGLLASTLFRILRQGVTALLDAKNAPRRGRVGGVTGFGCAVMAPGVPVDSERRLHCAIAREPP
jgi:hypothetical protein